MEKLRKDREENGEQNLFIYIIIFNLKCKLSLLNFIIYCNCLTDIMHLLLLGITSISIILMGLII